MSKSSDVLAVHSNRPLKNRLTISGVILIAAFLAVLLTATLCVAGAQWNPNGVPVSTATGDQYDQQVISDGAGGAFVAWTDYRSSGAGPKIYAQRIDSSGKPLWSTNGVPVARNQGSQYAADLTSDGAGGVIIVWIDYRSGNSDIYAQRLDGSGRARWLVGGVPVDNNSSYEKNHPKTAADGSGGAIVIYDGKYMGTGYTLLAQRINQSGVNQWASPAQATTHADYYYHNLIAAADGSSIMTWEDVRNGDNIDIYAQRLNGAGTVQWAADGAPVCTAPSGQWYPEMASDNAGGAIITWEDLRSGDNYDIYAQRMKRSGSSSWRVNGVKVCVATGDQEYPMITADGAGGAIVTWQDGRAGTQKIYTQKLSAGGTVGWASNGVAMNRGGENSYEPVITSDGSGGAIVAWSTGIGGTMASDSTRRSSQKMDPASPAPNARVFVQQVLSSGITSPGWAPDGVAVCPESASTLNAWPQIATDGSGGAIVAWEDYRSGNEDIYAQRMRTATATWYLAEGSSAWGYETYLTIQNPNQQKVTAKITYMTPKGPVKPQQVVLPPASQTTIHPLDYLKFQTDFSTKVECLEGRPLGVDRTMTWTGQGAPSPEAHSSIGVNAPAYAWYLPEGCSGYGFETWLLVQNPDAKQATCTFTYMIEGANPMTVVKKVAAHSRNSFNMAGDIGEQNASTMVSSDVPVIVERSMYRNNRREGHESIGATDTSTDYYLAEGSTAWGFTTYVLVENPNESSCFVNLTYMTPGGPIAMPPFSMPGYSRKTVRVNDKLPNTDFSTQVHSDQPIIAERAMYWGADTPLGEATHDTIGMVSPSKIFYFPDGQSSDGHETFTMVQNPNKAPVAVKVTYMTPKGTGNVSFTESIPALSRVTFNMSDKITSGRAAALVECVTAGKSVMAERSMYWNNRGVGTCTIGGASY